jgi:3-hydroxybutyryl-CoA dehydratase
MIKPNKLKFTDIKIGDSAEFEITVTETMVHQFANISGDFNSLHMDNEFAKTTKFGKRVCHGMLLGSFFSRLVGMYIPGLNALYLSQSLKFISPCFIDDKIIVRGTVIRKSERTKIITLQTLILNTNDKILVDGECKAVVLV